MPEKIVDNSFFKNGDDYVPAMFRGVELRHHVSEYESATEMISRASTKLAEKLNLNLAKDVDILITNVTCPDQPFTGCGASVAHQLGMSPDWVLDMHNGGCVSFIMMMAHAQALMATSGAKTALLCNVQNAGGRIFASEQNRMRKQARIPGDGCGVGYLVANDESPIRSIVQRSFGEYAKDMEVIRDDESEWWEPSQESTYVNFTETKIAEITARANRIVPDAIFEACQRAGLATDHIDALITNQPNRIFLRNWREAIQISKERHLNTFQKHGNLFGAAFPIIFEEAVETGRIRSGHRIVMAGFSHAGDFAAAAVLHWQPEKTIPSDAQTP